MHFKIDENLPLEVSEQLRGAGHQASTTKDEGLDGGPDRSLADVVRREGKCLVTLDLDFADIRTYAPKDFHGIVVLRPALRAKPQVLRLIESVIELLKSELPSGSLWIVEDGRIRIRRSD
jgi:predicted nuclease of predicted toxin-antitoxin system